MNELSAEQQFWQHLEQGNFERALEAANEAEEPQDLLIIHQVAKSQNLECLALYDYAADDFSPIYCNLIRLFLENCDTQPLTDFADQLLDYLLENAADVAKKIQKDSNNYPLNPISGATWMNGAQLRTMLNFLLDYLEKHESAHEQLLVQFYKTCVTLAIMGHYKQEVGPDMIATARLYIADGKPEAAQSSYQAVINDFEEEIENYLEYFESEEFDYEESDRLILSSLQAAYLGLHQLQPETDFSQQLAQLDVLLEKMK